MVMLFKFLPEDFLVKIFVTSKKYIYISKNLFKKRQFTFRGSLYRSSHPEVFCKSTVLRNLAIFTGKHDLYFTTWE